MKISFSKNNSYEITGKIILPNYKIDYQTLDKILDRVKIQVWIVINIPIKNRIILKIREDLI